MNGSLRGLSTLNDVHIPRLRDLPSSRNSTVSLPHEVVDHAHVNDFDRSLLGNEDETRSRVAPSASIEALASRARDRHDRERELKKPHLAISELVDPTIDADQGQVQLPSFVSLSVVEKSPTPGHVSLGSHHGYGYPHKRPRLDTSSEQLDPAHDMNRTLPRPIQKDDKQVIPLLPAMVTGLHEPPPSAALLPSMSDARPPLQRSATTTSKMQVKDILSSEKASTSRPPEQMLNTPEVAPAELPRAAETQSPEGKSPSPQASTQVAKKEPKVRRTRRKWSEAETRDLLAGVKKHGFGKWKQILIDPIYTFDERTSIDLKDRYRVFAKDLPETVIEPVHSDDAQPDSADARDRDESSEPKASNNAVSSKRRKRHPWTREEDNALLAGVQKHGFQWTEIHNDTELGLTHRRATDLRDRIRNLYPDDYKHAEARPLRAEMKRAEKAGKKETPAGTLYAPPAQMDTMNFPTPTNTAGAGASGRNAASSSPSPRGVARRQTTSGKVPSIAALTQPQDENDLGAGVVARPTPRRSKTLADFTETSGITLPSLALDPANDAEDWDNTLPPFMNWEHEI